MGFWRGRGKEPPEKPAPVQLRPADRHPFSLIDGYVPLHQPEFSLYRAIREAVPLLDSAIRKIVRLTGGVVVRCQRQEQQGGYEVRGCTGCAGDNILAIGGQA